MEKRYVNELRSLAEKLENKNPSAIKSIVGFDGFIDEVVHVVDKRLDSQNYTRVSTLEAYGKRIAATAGLSSNVEIVTISKKLGGNGPILANALLEYGVHMSYVGALGYPDVHPVFCGMADRCDNVMTMADPSATDAVEFEDGKIIRAKLSAFQELTYDNLKERIGLEVLAEVFDRSDLIGFVNWALPPFSGLIWKGILSDVMPMLKNETRQKIFFFDLADPASRQTEELHDALRTIEAYAKRYRVVLGLNLREAVQVANSFGANFDFKEDALEDIARCIRRFIEIDTLVIHPVKESCCLIGGEFVRRIGPYCANPVLTTGAGDNFNAGFILGICLGLTAQEALLLGMAISGFYVRNARSANLDEIKQFILLWANGELA